MKRIAIVAIVIAMLAGLLVVPTPVEADVYSCLSPPYTCYDCFCYWPWWCDCWPLGYGVLGYCGCQDESGCETFGTWCEAIIIYP